MQHPTPFGPSGWALPVAGPSEPVDRRKPAVGRHALAWNPHHFAAGGHHALAQVVEQIVHLRIVQLARGDGTTGRIHAARNLASGVEQQRGDAAGNRRRKREKVSGTISEVGTGEVESRGSGFLRGAAGKFLHAGSCVLGFAATSASSAFMTTCVI